MSHAGLELGGLESLVAYACAGVGRVIPVAVFQRSSLARRLEREQEARSNLKGSNLVVEASCAGTACGARETLSWLQGTRPAAGLCVRVWPTYGGDEGF